MEEKDPESSLLQWNQLNVENTENAMVSSMFKAFAKANEPLNAFCTWLLVATAAIASFFISNADKIIPILQKNGFFWCGLCLCISCICGVLAKYFGLMSKINSEVSSSVEEALINILEKHDYKRSEIEKCSELSGIDIQTDIDMARVVEKFLEPMPCLFKWLVNRFLVKNKDNPHIGYLPIIKNINRQSAFVVLQVILFLFFLLTGIIFASL